MYTVNPKLIGKLVQDFIFVLIELISLGLMAEGLPAKWLKIRIFEGGW